MPAADSHGAARQWPAAGVGTGRTAPPLPLSTNGAPPSANGGPAGWARNGGAGTGTGARGPAQPPVRRTGPMPAAPTSAAGRVAAGPPNRAGADRDVDAVTAIASRRRSGAARDAVLVAVPPPVPVAGPGHGTHARPAAAAVRRRRHRARRPWLLPDRGAAATEPARRPSTTPTADRELERAGHERSGDGHAARDGTGRHAAGLDRGRREHLPVAAVHPGGPHRGGEDDAGLRHGLRHLEFQRSRRRPTAPRWPAWSPRRRTRRSRTTSAPAAQGRGQAGVHRQRHDRLDQLVRPEPGVDHILSHHRQQVVPANGANTSPSQYSVTVVSSGGGWQVNNIELSSLGNQ